MYARAIASEGGVDVRIATKKECDHVLTEKSQLRPHVYSRVTRKINTTEGIKGRTQPDPFTRTARFSQGTGSSWEWAHPSSSL